MVPKDETSGPMAMDLYLKPIGIFYQWAVRRSRWC